MTGHRILILDEDETTINYLGFNLKKEGYQVFASTNTKEGMISAFKNRPHVMIIDPAISDMPIEDLLSRLKKDRRLTRSKLIAFSSLSNPKDIQAAIDLGFEHYIAKEGDAFPGLLNAVQGAIEDLTATRPSKTQDQTIPNQDEDGGKTIIFLSAKGGTGTSSVCANLAHMCNEFGDNRIAVVDLVLPIGSIATIVGYEGSLNIVEVAAMTAAETSTDYLQEALPKPEYWDFQLLAGSPDPQMANELDAARIPILIDTMRKAFEYIFVDLGNSLSRISLPIIQTADQIVLILSLDEATAKLTSSVWDFLKSNGVKPEQVYHLINRAVGLEGFSKSEVEDLLGVGINNAIPYMERNFTLANNQHRPILQKFPDDAATIAMRQAVREISQRIEEKSITPDLF